jgi:hypothetical protein
LKRTSILCDVIFLVKCFILEDRRSMNRKELALSGPWAAIGNKLQYRENSRLVGWGG